MDPGTGVGGVPPLAGEGSGGWATRIRPPVFEELSHTSRARDSHALGPRLESPPGGRAGLSPEPRTGVPRARPCAQGLCASEGPGATTKGVAKKGKRTAKVLCSPGPAARLAATVHGLRFYEDHRLLTKDPAPRLRGTHEVPRAFPIMVGRGTAGAELNAPVHTQQLQTARVHRAVAPACRCAPRLLQPGRWQQPQNDHRRAPSWARRAPRRAG